MKWKSINRNTFNIEFEEYLKTLTPNKDVLECFENIFLDLLKNRKSIFEKQELEW